MKGALDFDNSPKKPKFSIDYQSSLLVSVACSLFHCGLQTRWDLPWILLTFFCQDQKENLSGHVSLWFSWVGFSAEF